MQVFIPIQHFQHFLEVLLSNLVLEVNFPESIKNVFETDRVGVNAIAHDGGRGVIRSIGEGSGDLRKELVGVVCLEKKRRERKNPTDPEVS